MGLDQRAVRYLQRSGIGALERDVSTNPREHDPGVGISVALEARITLAQSNDGTLTTFTRLDSLGFVWVMEDL